MTPADLTAAEAETWSYIGRTQTQYREYPPFSVLCAVVDDPKRTSRVNEAIVEWVRGEMIVHRVPTAWVRLHFGSSEPYPAAVQALDPVAGSVRGVRNDG